MRKGGGGSLSLHQRNMYLDVPAASSNVSVICHEAMSQNKQQSRIMVLHIAKQGTPVTRAQCIAVPLEQAYPLSFTHTQQTDLEGHQVLLQEDGQPFTAGIIHFGVCWWDVPCAGGPWYPGMVWEHSWSLSARVLGRMVQQDMSHPPTTSIRACIWAEHGFICGECLSVHVGICFTAIRTHCTVCVFVSGPQIVYP